MPPKYKLIYFDAPGRAEVIRMLFHLAGVPFEDVRLEATDWIKMKRKTPFGQLPVLEITEDEEAPPKILCQSFTITRYVAQQYNLAGSSTWESAQCDAYVDTMTDVLQPYVVWKYMGRSDAEKEAAKKVLLEDCLPPFFQKISKALEKNSAGFLVGEKMTWADVSLAYIVAILEGESFDFEPYPKALELKDKIYGHPNLSSYLEQQLVKQADDEEN